MGKSCVCNVLWSAAGEQAVLWVGGCAGRAGGEGGASFGRREVRREVPGLVIAECLCIGAGAGVISTSAPTPCTAVPLWTLVG